MATIQEMQKARELMKTGLDLKTAVAQARTPVTPTSQINQDRLAQNQASRQANPVTPVTPTQPAPITPAPIVNAPVDQTTGLSKPLEPVSQPVQPAPIPTPAQPVANPKVDTTPGITQDAFQQAKAESEKIKAQNDAVMAQNQQKAELARQDEAMKAEALIPKDEKGVLNALISGASVPKQNTQEYRNAEFKANNFRKFNSMTPTQLLDNLKQGQISSEMDQLLSQNPNYTQAKQKLNEQQKITNLNKTMNNIVNGVKGKEVATTTPEQDEEDISIKLMQKYGLDDANAQAFSQFVATDDEMADNKAKLLANRNQLSSVNRQIADATKLFNDGVSQLKKDYPNISASAIITLMGSRLGEFNDAITNLNSTKTLLQADIKDEMDLAKSAYDAKSADIKSQNEIRKAMALNEYKADFEKQQAEQALNDPATQIGQTMAEFEKMGITSQGSLASKIAEFKTSGLSLPEYVNNLRKLYMAKPEYQRIQSINQGKLSDIEKFQMQNAVEDRRDLRNFAQQKELAKFNNDLNRQEFLFKIENDPAQKAKTLELEKQLSSNKSLFDVLGKNVGTYEGNRGYDLAGNLGDPLPAGGNWTVKSVDTAGEQVGSIFIGGKGKKPYGNTVVMQDENGNEIRYSHLQNIGVKPGDILGFGDIVGTRGNTGNVKGANGETLTAEQLKAGRGAHVDIEIKDKSGRLLSNADQVNFLKGLKAGGGISSSSLPLYRAYMEDNKLPSKDALAGLGMTSEQFTNNASTGYDQFLRSKENEINSTYPTLQIQFTPSYASLSATQREKLNESMTKIGDIDMRLEKLKKLFDENGTEVLPTKAKKEMQSLKQQIILKAKEVENLGVLNGPDLGILESLIPETTGIMSGLFSFDDNTKTTLNSIQSNYRSDAKTKGINYGAKIGFKGMDEPMQQQTNNKQKVGGEISPQAQSIEQEWLSRK